MPVRIFYYHNQIIDRKHITKGSYMNKYYEAMVKEIQEEVAMVMANGNRVARATENYYTAVLNEGFDGIADGVLVANLPFCIEPTQTAISRYCKWVAVCFHPTNYADFSALHHVNSRDNGIHINGFYKEGLTQHDYVRTQEKVMSAVKTHVDEKFRAGMVRNVHEIVMETQMQYWDCDPYSLPDGGIFPRQMDDREVVSQVMVAIAEKLEAMV